LHVKNLKTYYFTNGGIIKAVDDVSFDIEKGTILGLVGESGCGKSTVALSVMRLVPIPGKIVSGEITLNSDDILTKSYDDLLAIRWKIISMVFQGSLSSLNPLFRVQDQIAEAISAHESVKPQEAIERTRNLLRMVGIDPSRGSSYPHEMSGGMKQRVLIAMALACQPEFVIADEPTTALDVNVQAQVLSLLKTLQEKMHLTMLYISHDLPVIAEFCDAVAVMYAGKLVEYAPSKIFFKEPQHPYSVGLLKAFPRIDGKLEEIVSIPGTPPALIAPPVGCRFHPRCSYIMDICRREEPALTEISPGHRVACHLMQKQE
jgi:peptide/nickel transport system ATP-binding protein